MAALSSPLTCEKLRDELRKFGREALRSELEDVRIEMRHEMRSVLTAVQALRDAPIGSPAHCGDAPVPLTPILSRSESHEWMKRNRRGFLATEFAEQEEGPERHSRPASGTSGVPGAWSGGDRRVNSISSVGKAVVAAKWLASGQKPWVVSVDEGAPPAGSWVRDRSGSGGDGDHPCVAGSGAISCHSAWHDPIGKTASTGARPGRLLRAWGTIRRTPEFLRCAVLHKAFDAVSATLVILNFMVMIMQAEYVAVKHLRQAPMGFHIVETCFAVAFFLELVLKIWVHRGSFFCGEAMKWNIFDCAIVSVVCLEQALSASVHGYGSSNSVAGNVGSFRVLRLLRLLRVVRIIRMLRFISDLRTLVSCIARSLRALCWTMVLLLGFTSAIAVYISTVSTARLFELEDGGLSAEGSGESLRRYFGSLSRTVLSLFQAITGGVDWNDLVTPLTEEVDPAMAFFFSLYIAFSVIAVLNVVTGVFVESALKSTKEDNELFLIAQLREMFRQVKGSSNGKMTRGDFEELLETSLMQDYFRAIDLDISEANGLFRLLDLDGSDSVSSEEFLSGCFRLHGPAKALDLSLLMFEVQHVAEAVHQLSNDFVRSGVRSAPETPAVTAAEGGRHEAKDGGSDSPHHIPSPDHSMAARAQSVREALFSEKCRVAREEDA